MAMTTANNASSRIFMSCPPRSERIVAAAPASAQSAREIRRQLRRGTEVEPGFRHADHPHPVLQPRREGVVLAVRRSVYLPGRGRHRIAAFERWGDYFERRTPVLCRRIGMLMQTRTRRNPSAVGRQLDLLYRC